MLPSFGRPKFPAISCQAPAGRACNYKKRWWAL